MIISKREDTVFHENIDFRVEIRILDAKKMTYFWYYNVITDFITVEPSHLGIFSSVNPILGIICRRWGYLEEPKRGEGYLDEWVRQL